jgi:dephospho-CoA kinase
MLQIALTSNTRELEGLARVARCLEQCGATLGQGPVTASLPAPGTAATRSVRPDVVVDQVLTPDLDDTSRFCAYQLVIAVCSDTGARPLAADVSIDGAEPGDRLHELVGELWRRRLVPFAQNLHANRRAPRLQRAILVDPDPTWPAQAQRLIARLHRALGDTALRIDHVGSTSVLGLAAKNLIDVLVVVDDLDAAAAAANHSRAAGLVRVPGDWLGTDRNGHQHLMHVAVDADPGRPVNVNIHPLADPVWRDKLLFRDWLRHDPAGRADYAAMKRELSRRPGFTVDEYSDAKVPWIRAALSRAESWASTAAWSLSPSP